MERPSTQLDNAYSNTTELNRVVSSILENMIDDKLKEAPAWFTTEMDSIKSSFAILDNKVTSLDNKVASLDNKVTSLDNKVTSLDNKVTSLETDMDNKLAILEHNHLYVFNFVRRRVGYDAVSVPFLNREENQEELPSILCVQDIDRLTKEQCQKYLRGYNVQFHSNETIKLKERLRDALALIGFPDRDYQFASFST